MVSAATAAVGIILSPVAGAAFDKFSPRGVGISGLALMTISLGLLGTINTRDISAVYRRVLRPAGIGQAIANMPIDARASTARRTTRSPAGNAIANTGRRIAAYHCDLGWSPQKTSMTASHVPGCEVRHGQRHRVLLPAVPPISLVAPIICIFTRHQPCQGEGRTQHQRPPRRPPKSRFETTNQPARGITTPRMRPPPPPLFKQGLEQSIGGIMDDQPSTATLDSDDIMWCASSSASTSPAFPW